VGRFFETQCSLR